MLSSKNLVLVVAASCFFAVAWIAYVWLTTVEKKDIYAFHDVETPIIPQTPLRPGDIVEVDHDGEIFPICRLAGAPESASTLRMETYYNKLHDNFGAFQETFRSFGVSLFSTGGAGDGPVVQMERREIVFRGHRLAPGGTLEDFTEFEEENCDQQMAAVFARDSKVCTVVRSIIEVRSDNTGMIQPEVVAIQFKGYVNVPKQVLLDRGVEPDEIERLYAQRCAVNKLPYDVQVRNWLNVIGQRQDVTAAES